MKNKYLIDFDKLFRVYVDTKANIIVVEANWEDPDNTEEWFCHLGEDLKNLAIKSFHIRCYTYDEKWYVIANPKNGEFTVHNVKYDFDVTFCYCCFIQKIRKKKHRR